MMPRLLLLTVAATLAAIMFMTPVSDADAVAEAVNTTVGVDKPVVLLGDARPVYVLVRFAAPDSTPTKDRPLLNLSLVLDRSGSMESKGKLEYLKRAAKKTVDSLQGKDRLAIVEYDDRVTVLWPSSPVESPAMVKRLIDALEPRASTNLAGGLVAGIEQVEETISDDRLTRVLLLSDGLANIGITDPREIRKLVRKGKMKGVRVSTLGLGLDYNEDLMQDIA
jgi:Ca-activated chloride channel family protein